HPYAVVDYRYRLARLAAELAAGQQLQPGGQTAMTAGHFGLAAGVKQWAPRLPLWALMLSTYLLDVIFIFFFAAGLESLAPADPAQPMGYGNVLIQAYYTHSLLGALLIAAVAGWVAGRSWGQQGGLVV